MKTSILMVVAGPNGSGKSTITSEIQIIGYYINADEIQREKACDPLEAAKIATATREYMLKNKQNFTFESVLSTTRNFNLIEKAKRSGYKVICIYVLTNDPEINVTRVEERVKMGGHDVSSEKIRERYHRAMKLFPKLFTLCDELYVYDNSYERGEGEPERIVSMQNGIITLSPTPKWSLDDINKLCSGTYSC